MDKLKHTVIISATLMLALLIGIFILLCMEVVPGKFIGRSIYLMLTLLTINVVYLLYTCGNPKRSIFYDYLFLPGDYRWLMTNWFVFFLLSATNLFGPG